MRPLTAAEVEDERASPSGFLDEAPAYWAFADEVMAVRRQALDRLDVGQGGIEYAALVMADAAAEWLLNYDEETEHKIAAARSTVLMLCDAGIIVPHGFPGGLQWLHPAAALRQRPRRERRRQRRARREGRQ